MAQMKKVKMLVDTTTHKEGETVTINEIRARSWIKAGWCVLTEEKQPVKEGR